MQPSAGSSLMPFAWIPEIDMKSSWVLLASLLSATTFASGEPLTPAQRELVEAERAFVRLAAERGFRDSFFEFFAEEGIGFNPHPMRMKANLANQPSAPGPWGVVWAPVYGDIAAAGDLGWNTGPLVIEGRGDKPDGHGLFFSVWKRQPDGSWRVVLDVGSLTPSRVVTLDAPFQSTHRAATVPAANVDVAAEIAALLAIEREFLAIAESESLGRAYGGRLADEARVHRPAAMPIVGRDALAEWANAQDSKVRGEPLAADVSISGDLGYAYGSFESEGSAGGAGYYARVWKKSAGGDWRIVFDTISPLPAGVKPLSASGCRADSTPI